MPTEKAVAAPRPLFVTRRFPPSIGGMETLAADVWEVLERRCPGAILVAHRSSNRGLLQFIVRAWWQTLRARKRCDVVVTYDATTYLMMWPLLAVLRLPSVAIANGLDLTFPNIGYQAAVRFIAPRAKRVLAISAATAEVAREIGVPDERCAVLPIGVVVPPAPTAADKVAAGRAARARCGVAPDTTLLFTLGRLVARKGVRWFVAEVMPQMPDSVHYVVAGSGPDQDALEAAIDVAGLRDRVHVLGRVDDDDRELLLLGADLFVQPNIPVSGDMEGFGLVVVEAALRATPVVASALEGLTDAVVDGETGMLCPPEDAVAWRDLLRRLLGDPAALVELGERFRCRAAELNGLESMGEVVIEALAVASAKRDGQASN